MKTMHIVISVMVLITITGSITAQGSNQKGTGERHNGEYIVPSPADSAGGSLSAGDRTTEGTITDRTNQPVTSTSGDNNAVAPNQSDNNTAVIATTDNGEAASSDGPCSSCKWSWIGLLGLLGLAGLYRRGA